MLLEPILLTALAAVAQPAPTAPAPPVPSAPATGELVWHEGALSNAVGKARTKDQMVLIYFWMDGSESCKTFWQDTLASDSGQQTLGEFVLYSAKHGTAQGGALFERYGVQVLPSMVFLTPDGAVEDLIGGIIEPAGLAAETARIRRGEGTVSDLRAKAAAHTQKDEEAFQARFDLADRLGVLGQREEAEGILASIRTDDPHGKTKLGAELNLEHLFGEVAEAGGGDEHMAEWDLEPFTRALKKVKHDEVRFAGWNKVGNVEAARTQVTAACDAFGEAWKLCPEEKVFWWAGDVAAYVIHADGERTKQEKKFALELAKAAVEAQDTLACEYTDQGCECDVCTHPEGLVADRMAMLARAYHLSGNEKKALQIAKQCVEMDPEGEHGVLVAELEARG